MNRAGYILTGVAASCEASHTTPRNLILGLKSDRSKLVVASGKRRRACYGGAQAQPYKPQSGQTKAHSVRSGG
jgi:hypothetical protein